MINRKLLLYHLTWIATEAGGAPEFAAVNGGCEGDDELDQHEAQRRNEDYVKEAMSFRYQLSFYSK